MPVTKDQAKFLESIQGDFQVFLDYANEGIAADADQQAQACYLLAWSAVDHASRIPSNAMPGLCQFLAIANKNQGVANNLLIIS